MCALGFELRGNNRKCLSHLSPVNDSLLWNFNADDDDGDDDDVGDDDDDDVGDDDDDGAGEDDAQRSIDKQTADNSANTVADKWSFWEETETDLFL